MVPEVLAAYTILMIIMLPVLRILLRDKLSSERGFLVSYVLAYMAPLYVYCIKYSLVHIIIGLSLLNIVAIAISVTRPIYTWLGIPLVPIPVLWILILARVL